MLFSMSLIDLVEDSDSPVQADPTALVPADLAFLVEGKKGQKDLVCSTTTRDIAIVPRQAGKTTGAVLRALKVAMIPGTQRVTYVTKTRRNAKRLFWRPLLDTAARLGLDILNNANHGDLTLTVKHSNGGYCLIELMGAHDQDKIEDLRGTQYDLVIVDEAQLIRPAMLESLLMEILVPGCRARKGAILLIGTPGPVKMGPFYEHWIGDKWNKFRWTAWENPYTPPGSIEEEVSALGLKPEDPRYIREYLGEWYDGYDDTLVWEYEPGRNDSDVILPASASDAGYETWRYSWGIDLASNQDNDALVVLGWDSRDAFRRLYEVDSWQQPGTNTTDELEIVLKQKRVQWKPTAAIGDDGGHGAKKIIRTLAPRLGLVFGKKPTDVEATMRLINTDLRKGRMKVRRGHELAQDMLLECWEVDKAGKRKIGGQKHSDLTAACRYAYMASYAHKARGYAPEITDPDEKKRIAITKSIEEYERQKRKRRGQVRGRASTRS